MKKVFDLSQLEWRLAGYAPFGWTFMKSMEIGADSASEIPAVRASVPGSVQGALRAAGKLPDWNMGMKAKECEWVENRHWIYETRLPDKWMKGRKGRSCRLHCMGLDYSGWVILNGTEVGTFKNSMIPHSFDLAKSLKNSKNVLRIIFDCAPRWLGQFGYTTRMTEWKPRFNYTWDWQPRLMQIGIWDGLFLELADPRGSISSFRSQPDYDLSKKCGVLKCNGRIDNPAGCKLRISLLDGKRRITVNEFDPKALARGIKLGDLDVSPWQTNGEGKHPLYDLKVELFNRKGRLLDERRQRVGFKHVEWTQCRGAPKNADPWICNVNGKATFLQGVDWTPILPNFADVKQGDYRKQLRIYRDLGFNVLRVWGGAALEKKWFYDLCDEFGILVWQEFPLSSSGTENWPPEEPRLMDELVEIARSYIERRQHHASLLLWCGGNELQGDLEGNKKGTGKPVTLNHPLMKRWKKLIDEMDPGRRFLVTSSSGPRFFANKKDFGKGLHWDVHGPWKCDSDPEKEWKDYWENDDSLFRSELGCPSASPVDIIRKYSGGMPVMPPNMDNPLWRRTMWWGQLPQFMKEHNREPRNIEEYVKWSLAHQSHALEIAVRACKDRFPGIGGAIIWMGRDAFPCMANTSIFDFHGRPKPAALAVGRIFRGQLKSDINGGSKANEK
ncbi:MAG: hypothetical protein A2X48_16020 [Lentisphaerae bacterium GWF2_49_21]|nr:MAG: hypothetical protein A2X48_16020 [Lentisphaerae bacterium GWF2_49_21]